MTYRTSRELVALLSILVLGAPLSTSAQDLEVPDAPAAPPAPPAAPAPAAPPAPPAPPAQPAPSGGEEEWSDEDLLDEIEDELEEEPVTPPQPSPSGAAEPRAAAPPEAVAIEQEGALTLPEAVVSYSLEDALRTGGAVDLVSQEQLETYEYADPHQVLLRVPGVYVRGEDGFGLRPNIGLRGTRSDRSSSITLMEDGVLFGPAPYSAPAAYYFPLVTRMVGVEVFKGPAAILFGPFTVGGAINFLAREVPEEPSGEIDLSYGMYRSRKLHLHYGASNRWGGILFEGIDLASDGFKHIDFSDDSTGFHRSEFMVRSFVQSDPNGRIYNRLELKLGYSRELSHETYLGLTDADFREDAYRRYSATQNDRMHWNRYQVELLHRLSVGERFDLFTTAYRHDFHRVWSRMDHFADGTSLYDVTTNPTGTNLFYLEILRGERDSSGNLADRLIQAINDRRFVSQGVQSTARYRFSTGKLDHLLEAGVRFHYDSIDREHGARGYETRSTVLVPDGITRPQTADEEASTFAFAGYAMWGIDWDRLRLSPGVRTEVIHNWLVDYLGDPNDHQDRTRAVVLPGVGAQYQLNDWLGVLGGVHRGFSPVAPGQAAAVEPELSISYEAGARVHHEEWKIDAEAIAFFNDYSNVLLNCTGSSACAMLDSQFNGGSANIAGFELMYAQSLRVSDHVAIPVRGTYTFTHARLDDAAVGITSPPEFAGAQDGDFIPYLPMHQAAAELGIDWDRLRVRLNGVYVGEMLERVGDWGEETTTDRYLMLDVVGHYRLIERAELYVQLENVTNAQPIVSRRPYGARPVRPFQASVGLKVDL